MYFVFLCYSAGSAVHSPALSHGWSALGTMWETFSELWQLHWSCISLFLRQSISSQTVTEFSARTNRSAETENRYFDAFCLTDHLLEWMNYNRSCVCFFHSMCSPWTLRTWRMDEGRFHMTPVSPSLAPSVVCPMLFCLFLKQFIKGFMGWIWPRNQYPQVIWPILILQNCSTLLSPVSCLPHHC